MANYQPHMTMRSILQKEETRKSDYRDSIKRQRPKSKKTLDLIKDIK